MKLFPSDKQKSNSHQSDRNRDIWLETQKKEPASVVLEHGKYERAVVMKLSPGVYKNYPAASGTESETNIVYARFSPWAGLYFTALDMDLEMDFASSIVLDSNEEITTEEALEMVEKHSFHAPRDLESQNIDYLYRSFAKLLESKNQSDEYSASVSWLMDAADRLLSAKNSSEQAYADVVRDVKSESKKQVGIQTFFESQQHTLPWSLGARIKTSLKPLHTFYQELIADKSDEEVSEINSLFLSTFGETLSVSKVINGVLDSSSTETLVSKKPFELKNDQRRLSLFTITEKFARGYQQIAVDLLGLTPQVAQAHSLSTQQDNFRKVHEVLSLWENVLEDKLRSLGSTPTAAAKIEKASDIITAGFRLSAGKSRVIEAAIQHFPELFSKNFTNEDFADDASLRAAMNGLLDREIASCTPDDAGLQQVLS